MATIHDIARAAGVSKSTVSRVLSNQGYVKKETRNRIDGAIKELDYSPNYIARGMRTNKSSAIGLFIPDYSNPFYSELFKGVEKITRKAGYMNLVCHTDEDPKAELYYIGELIKRQIDGIIFCTYNRSPEGLQYLKRLSESIPLVFMDPVFDDQEFSCVVSDGFTGTKNAVNYLISKGCSNIAYIKGPRIHAVTRERYRGYIEALKESDFELNRDMVYEGDFSIESGREAVRHFMNQERKPDALLAVTDVMAIGALKELRSMGVRIPEEVKVIGFDNIPLSELIEPSLTTIAQPIKELGMNAAELLLKKIADPAAPNQQVVMQCSMVERKSAM